MQINIKTNFKDIFDIFLKQKEFVDLLDKVDQLYSLNEVFPPKNLIFDCFNYFNIADTKVVIIGQDPYHGINQANGLAFSVNDNVKLPKSLINIFKEFGVTPKARQLMLGLTTEDENSPLNEFLKSVN